MTKNNKSESLSKHFDIKYLAIREKVKDKKVIIELMIVDHLAYKHWANDRWSFD